MEDTSMYVDRALMLQCVNGYIAVTSLIGAFIFMRYIVKNKELGYAELRPAMAFLALFVGGLTLWGSTFAFRVAMGMGFLQTLPLTGILIGGIFIEIAFLCSIRVFSPNKWRFWPWLGTLILATIVVAGSLVLVDWY
jgi:hypothetical protein